MIDVYKNVIEDATATVASREAISPLNINVKEMPIEGLATVQDVGAWSVRQVVNLKSKCAKENLLSLNQKTHQSACDCYEMRVLFQDHIIDNFQVPRHSDDNRRKTVSEKGSYSHQRRGVSFFLEVEALCVELLNEHNLRQKGNTWSLSKKLCMVYI